MDNMRIPRIEGLGNCNGIEEFRTALDAVGVKGSLECLNWAEWPEKPSCKFSMGWCREGIGILFDVEGRDLRAQALEDNGSVWEDSCCELFISDPEDGTYYNFEMTCVGSLLIIAISLNMLGVTKIKVMNFVPAIFLPILLCRVL